MMLNNIQVKAAKPNEKRYRLTDSDGLYLEIDPNGSKYWRVRVQINGKRVAKSLGKYPEISLARARELSRLCKLDIKSELSQLKKMAHSFESVALEWHKKQSNTWSTKHQSTVIQRLEKNVFPIFGQKPIDEVTSIDILGCLRLIEQRNAFETAHRVKSIIGQVFRYAIPHQYCDRDLTQDLRGALTPHKAKHYASITEPTEIGALLRAIDDLKCSVANLYAMKIMPYLFVRSYSLRYAEWNEFDLDAKLWRIPGSKMKKSEPLLVPLSEQVICLILQLKQYNLSDKFLFPGLSNDRPISDGTMRMSLRRMGYTSEQMTVHGFRHMASTRLNEMGYHPDWIERQLAHTEGDKVRAAYNHAEYLPQRTKMMQDWANYLDKLKGNVSLD